MPSYKSSQRSADNTTLRICMIGIMAALIFVSNYIRVPFMETSLHPANGLCALAGLLFGPGAGFLAAGIGSFLYDIIAGYGAESLITLVSKGAIGLVAGFIGYKAAHHTPLGSKDHILVILAAVIGALTYVALYMLKTYIFGITVRGLTVDATIVSMAAKLPGSMINAVFAFIIAPVLLFALRPALKHFSFWAAAAN